ncbi:MAG: GGDEF domain-containing protein [Firmicutes bacterium]|nr:GGDEF domain-containing protein [Bacillota bacterium]
MDELNKAFKNLIVFIVVSVILTTIIFYIPMKNIFIDKGIKDLENKIDLQATNLGHKIELYDRLIHSVTSRTFIKDKLFIYYNKKISLNELKIFTQSKFEDGVDIYENLISAKRYSFDGFKIATYGNFKVFNKFNTNKNKDIIQTDNKIMLMIKKNIFKKGIYLGYDIAVFDITYIFNKIDNNSSISYSISDTRELNKNKDLITHTDKIKNTNYYLVGTVNRSYINKNINDARQSTFIFSITIIVMTILLSHFTLNKNAKQIINKCKTTNERIQKYAMHDTLTGIYNRRMGIELLKKKKKDADINDSKLTVCFVDINNLKKVNDTYGHKEGDRFIKCVSDVMDEEIRKADYVSRMGGDEFLIVFPHCDMKDAKMVLERILTRFKDLNYKNKYPYKIGISYGLSEYIPNSNKKVDKLISEADEKMYKHKEKLKNKGY